MRKRILIIDDESDIREVAAASLELVGGFAVVGADSARHGLTIAEHEQPDLILLDLMMPEMDGCEALEQLKSNAATRAIPVILLTAKVHAMNRDAVLRAGAAGVLLKPFDPMLLSQQVCEITGWHAEQRDEASA